MNEFANAFVANWLYWAIPLLFLVVVAWIYRPTAKKRYKADGSIPFEGDKNKVSPPMLE
jgi:cbb3-type cytochrome oxidase subunit 3